MAVTLWLRDACGLRNLILVLGLTPLGDLGVEPNDQLSRVFVEFIGLIIGALLRRPAFLGDAVAIFFVVGLADAKTAPTTGAALLGAPVAKADNLSGGAQEIEDLSVIQRMDFV